MWRKLPLLACLAVHVLAQGRISNATSSSWTAELNGVWRWHAGDDLAWASASFDDSAWKRVSLPGSPPHEFRYWIRIPVELGRVSDAGLMLGPIAYAYEAYWDGRPIARFGDLSRGRWFIPRWQTFPLRRDLVEPGKHVIAIRIWQLPIGWGTRGARLETGENRIGELLSLQDAESAQMHAEFDPRLLQLLFSFGLLLAGLYFLLLPPSVSQGAAFRWLGVILLSRALVGMCQFYGNFGPLSIPGGVVVSFVWTLIFVTWAAYIEFPYALFRRRVPVVLRCVQGLLALLAFPVPLPYSAVTIRFGTLLIPSVVPVALVLSELRKRTPNAGLTLVFLSVWVAAAVANILSIYHISQGSFIVIAGMPLNLWDAVCVIWVPAITMQINKINQRFRDEQERLLGQMQAARQVQQLLLPSQVTQVSGFEIDAHYHPATEVGGDFFQLFPGLNDSLLLVIGDVSGKGMKAALLVSMIVGVLQNRKSEQPPELLRELNAVLFGRGEGGFTTCCCALFGQDGALTLPTPVIPLPTAMEKKSPRRQVFRSV